MTRRLGRQQMFHSLREFRGETVNSRRHAARNGFAHDQEIGRQPDTMCVASRTAAQRVSLVDGEQCSVTGTQLARLFPEIPLGQHHAGVRHDRFRQHASDLAIGKGAFERREIVEFDDASVRDEVRNRTDLSRTGDDSIALETHQRVFERAVITTVEHQNASAAGQRSRPAQHCAVRVRRGLGDLPARQPETFGQQLAGA